MFNLNVYVLDGLPLTVEADVNTSFDETTVDNMVLVDRNGRRAEWAERRLTDEDWEALEDVILENWYRGTTIHAWL